MHRRCFWDGHYQSEKKADDPLWSFLYLMMNCKHIRQNSITGFQSGTIKLIKYCVRGTMGCVLTLCWFQWQNFLTLNFLDLQQYLQKSWEIHSGILNYLERQCFTALSLDTLIFQYNWTGKIWNTHHSTELWYRKQPKRAI